MGSKPITSIGRARAGYFTRLDLNAANLRISRGSVPASTQLAEELKAAIVKQRLPRGGQLPTGRELIDRSGLSRVTVRAAVGLLERQAGWFAGKAWARSSPIL